jgi:hypothetical protein
LAHGGDADAVGESDGAELKGRKERMAHKGLSRDTTTVPMDERRGEELQRCGTRVP